MTTTPKPRGGARPGAGRPPAGTQDVRVRLTPEQRERLRLLGGGSISRGIALLISATSPR